jgi:hypothetical protein
MKVLRGASLLASLLQILPGAENKVFMHARIDEVKLLEIF